LGKEEEKSLEHSLPDGRKVKGLLHFYKKGDQWNYVTSDEYEQKKNELPALSFAMKYPVADLASKEWPDLEALSA
jgi:hypothetical protein